MIECQMCCTQLEASNTNGLWLKMGDEKGSARGTYFILCHRCQAEIANYILTTRGHVDDTRSSK